MRPASESRPYRHPHYSIMTNKEIFKEFLQMGLLACGGGHALLAQISRKLVNRRQVLTSEELADMTTMAASVPGPFGLNLSIAIGHRLSGWRGGTLAALATLIWPVVAFSLLALLYFSLPEGGWVQRFLRGLRPAIAALMLMPCYRLGQAACLNLTNIWLPLLTITAMVIFRITPIYVILAVALCAYLYGRFVKPQETEKD